MFFYSKTCGVRCDCVESGVPAAARNLNCHSGRVQEAAKHLVEHPWPQDPASLRIAKAGERGASSSSATTWKWDVLRPARFEPVGS